MERTVQPRITLGDEPWGSVRFGMGQCPFTQRGEDTVQRLSDAQDSRIAMERNPDNAARIRQAMATIQPKRYVCYRTEGAILVDGHLHEPSWQRAPWIQDFAELVDPEHVPCLATRAKMLWDDEYLYIGAELEDPDVWGTFTVRDSPICSRDTDFEVFIDPDGDALNYMEFEINALNCVWDLLLEQPYERGGPAHTEWNWEHMKTAVQVDGTLNAPWITDHGWTVEIALDWASMAPQALGMSCPPRHGDQWRLNMCRVHRDRGERVAWNWVWSTHGIHNMHVPEMFGTVQFSETVVGRAIDPFREGS